MNGRIHLEGISLIECVWLTLKIAVNLPELFLNLPNYTNNILFIQNYLSKFMNFLF